MCLQHILFKALFSDSFLSHRVPGAFVRQLPCVLLFRRVYISYKDSKSKSTG